MAQNHGGNIIEVSRQFNINLDNIIDFSANINFVGPPPDIYSKIRQEVESITRYPEPDSQQLKKGLAEKLGLTQNELIMGNGAVELIYILTRVLKFNKGLVLAPTFSEYEKALKAEDIEVKYHYLKRENKFAIVLDDLIKDLTEKIDIFFLCNPNNPTGKFITKDKIKKILKHNERNNIFTVIDEAFVDFLEQNISALSFLKDFKNIFILRSLTKFYAVPGLRLGYGIAQPQVIEHMRTAKDPWNINILAQKAGQVILNSKQYSKLTKKAVYREKIYLYKNLKKLPGLDVYYPNANYIFMDLSNTGYTSHEIYERLAERSLLIRNCSNYKGLNENYIRIAVKSREDNNELLQALNMLLNK